MNGSDEAGNGDPDVDESARQPVDSTDAATLTQLARVYDEVDAVPQGLVDRLTFGLAVDEVMAEVAQITRMPQDAMAVRGETSPERTQTLTFDAAAVTTMVTVHRAGVDRIRLDGWLAPAASMRVRLRMQGERRNTVCDESGRFSFDDLPVGFAQLSLHPAEPEGAEASVVTPVFEL